ncbi:MAG TPA: hypothetical protein PK668_21595 [Myxococcota bacterium]|nr:hypothetical protein [Myxococcota bacterium]HRY96073.1 hypothetical protein [Myxococcota bacterium]
MAGKKLDSLDQVRADGLRVPSIAEREALRAAARESPRYREVEAEVLEIFRAVYPGGSETDAMILEIDPNEFDQDPCFFYERVAERFEVPKDPANEYFGGYGGAVADTIACLCSRLSRGEAR